MSENVKGDTHDEWIKVTLGDIAINFSENEYDPTAKGLSRCVGLEHLDPGSLQIKRWSRITPEMSFTRKFSRGQILFGKRRAYQKKVALADFDGICSSDILVIESKKNNNFVQDLLPFLLQADRFFDYAVGTSSGSLSPRTKWKFLADYEVWLPSLDHQRRIATTLWAAEDCIVKGERYIAAAEREKQVLMRELFSKGIGHTEFKEVKGFRKLPKEWKILPINEICDIFDSKRIPLKEADRAKRKGSYPYYGAQGIIDWIDDFLFDGVFLLIAEDGENLKSKVLPIAYQVSGKFWVNNHAHVLKPKNGYEIGFIEAIFNSLNIDGFIVGSAQPKLTQDDLKKIKLPLPPLPEQRQVTSILTRCNETVAAARANVEATRALKMRLINQLLQTYGGKND